MEDPADELDAIAERLAGFRPAPPPTSHEMHFAAGLRVGQKIAARRYRLTLAAAGVICVAMVGLSVQQTMQNHRLQDAVAALQHDIGAAHRVLAAKQTEPPPTASLADSFSPRNRQTSSEPPSQEARQESIASLDHSLAMSAFREPAGAPLRWSRLTAYDVLRMAAPDSGIETTWYAARPTGSSGAEVPRDPMLTVGAGRSGTLSSNL